MRIQLHHAVGHFGGCEFVGKLSEAKWSSHQYRAGGILCLELQPDDWVLLP
jgi:hypothetical protein